MKSRHLKLVSALTLLVLALVLAFVEVKKSASPSLSSESIETLTTLNEKYNMQLVDELLEDNDKLVADLLKADVFSLGASSGHQGLLLSTRDSILLLEPGNSLAADKLEAIGRQYENAIPELLEAELDQDLLLTNSPVYGLSFDLPVTLSEEGPKFLVAVIDSGLDMSHEFFEEAELMAGWNTFSNDKTMYDDVGHGTHIAGIIHAQAPEAVIAPYKIVSERGGRLSNVVKAFNKAMNDEVDVINTSFGVLSNSTALRLVSERAESQGIIIVSAAGNLASDTGFYPASYPSTIAVGSVNAEGEMMEKSNFGDWVDVAAFGYRVESALPGNRYGVKSGTSQATAFVSAAVLRLLAGGFEVDEILEALQASELRVLDGELAGLAIVE